MCHARVNLGDPTFSYEDDDPDGMRSGMFRFGPQLGAQDTGAIALRAAAGPGAVPVSLRVRRGGVAARRRRPADRARPRRHARARAVGRRVLPARSRGRAPGAQRLRRDRCACCCGRTSSCRRRPSTRTSDKIGIWTGNPDDDLMVKRSSGVDYFTGSAEPARLASDAGSNPRASNRRQPSLCQVS